MASLVCGALFDSSRLVYFIYRELSAFAAATICFAAMMAPENLDGIGVGRDDEEPIVTDAQPKFLTPLESVRVTR
jgi:hypothetical protein